MRPVLTGVLLLLMAVPTMARPRDEVMINVYRCAAQASTRVWLDCYYGAAQPQRAALGLAPAPPGQVALVTTAPMPGVPQDLAARDAVIAAAAACGSVADERPWLDCYYAAADPVRQRLGLAPVGKPLPVTRPPAQTQNGPTKGYRTMASYTFDANGLFTVQMSDGETWRQLEGDTTYAHWYKKPESYAVTVTSGVLGSFNLRIKGDPHSYKVRRIS